MEIRKVPAPLAGMIDCQVIVGSYAGYDFSVPTYGEVRPSDFKLPKTITIRVTTTTYYL